jgi:hypothetical protein
MKYRTNDEPPLWIKILIPVLFIANIILAFYVF